MSGDYHAQRETIERRADRPCGGAHIIERVTAASTVLDDHRFAAPRIAVDD
jgi:hypothetical protein